MAFLGALKSRPFALLWSGQTISRFGDSVYRIALAWWVLEETGSPGSMGTVLVFSFAPMLLFLLAGGVATDRLPRLAVLFASDAVRGLATAVVAALAITGGLEVWHLYGLSLVEGLASAFFQPAYAAAVPEITPEVHLSSANALTSISGQAASIAGPSAGAVIVALGGTDLAFAIDAASFFVSAAFVALVPRQWRAVRAPGVTGGIVRDIREGFGTVLASPWIGVTICSSALLNVTFAAPMSVALPFIIETERGEGVGSLGLLYSLTAAGSVATAIWLGRRNVLRRRGIVAYLAMAVNGLLLVPFGLPVPAAVLWAAAAVDGACFAIFGLVWIQTLQQMVPGALLGRVSSIDALGSYALLPIGYGVAGWAVAWAGPCEVVIAGGLATFTIAALAIAHPAVRRLD